MTQIYHKENFTLKLMTKVLIKCKLVYLPHPTVSGRNIINIKDLKQASFNVEFTKTLLPVLSKAAQSIYNLTIYQILFVKKMNEAIVKVQQQNIEYIIKSVSVIRSEQYLSFKTFPNCFLKKKTLPLVVQPKE